MKNVFQNFNKPALTAFLAMLALASLATAGSLTPPGSPSSTMNTLAEVFDSIAGTFDSSTIVADQNGSLIEHLKYIEANMGSGGVSSDSLDFDEFVDNMTLDDPTDVALNGFDLTFSGIGNVGIGTTTPNNTLQVAGLISFDDANLNTALGSDALVSNATGFGNTAIGYQALLSNTDGIYNTATGYQALNSNTTGSENTANGVSALLSNTTGSGNTAYGFIALINNTTGSRNTATGRGAIAGGATGSDNSAYGYNAIASNTTGSQNTAIGSQTLIFNTTGNDNSAVGYQALVSNTTGSQNTANGYQALGSNTTGSDNTAIGYTALFSNTTGIQNTAIGVAAGLSAAGSGNVFLGYSAGSAETGSSRLYLDNSSTADPLIYGEFDNDYLRFNGDIDITGTASISGTLFANGGCIGCGGITSDSLDFDEFVDNMTLDADTNIANDGFALTFENASASGDFEVAGHVALGNMNGTFSTRPYVSLDIGENVTVDLTLEDYVGINNILNLNPSAAAGNSAGGANVDVSTDGAGIQDFSQLLGTTSGVTHNGSGVVTVATGLYGYAQSLGAGSVTTAIGGRFDVSAVGSSVGTAYAAYIGPALGTITNNYGLYVDDQSGIGSAESFNIYSAGPTSTNFFEGSVGIASSSPVAALSVQGTTRLDGHTAAGNSGGIDQSYFNTTNGFTNSSVLAINEALTTSTTDVMHGISSDVVVDMAADNAVTAFAGAGNYLTVPIGNSSDLYQIAGARNLATQYGDGDVAAIVGAFNLGTNWGDGTASNVYGSFNNACNCVEAGNITNAYGTYSSVNSSGTGTLTNAYDLFAEIQTGGGIITNNYGLYVADQGGAGVTNGYNIYSAGSGTRNIFEGSASVSGAFEVDGVLYADGGCVGCGGVTSDSLDFDEFKDAMTLDATTTIASAGFSLGLDTQGYTPTAALSIGRNPMSQGFLSSTTAAKLSVVRRMTATGIPLNVALFQNIWDLPAAGGGGTSVTIFNQIASSSAQNMTGQLTGLTAGSENVGTGTATTLIGLQAAAQNRNTGTTTNARAILAGPGSFSGGTVTNGYGVYALPSGTGSTITNMFGFYAARRAAGTTVTVSSWAGIGIEHLTEATNNTGLLIASTSSGLNIPAGNWGIYDASPYANYFGARASIAGNFGPTTTDTFDLGSSTLRWRDLYLASGSLHIGTSGDEAVIDYNVNDDYLAFKPDGSTTGMAILDGGNVGIGTTSPGAKLNILNGNIRVSSQVGSAGIELYPSVAGTPTSAGSIVGVGGSTNIAIMSVGNVGINDTTPTTTLDIAGSASVSADLEVTGRTTVGSFFGAGLTNCTGATTEKLLWNGTTGQFSCGTDNIGTLDYAELFFAGDAGMGPGDVVVADPRGTIPAQPGEPYNQAVKRSTMAGQATVLGIISSDPGMLLGENVIGTEGTVAVAVAGRVPVKVTGTVSVGDRLAASDVPGTAMKATGAGMTVGIALTEPYVSEGRRYAMVFVDPGYWSPSINEVAGETPLDGAGSSWLPETFAGLFAQIVGAFKDLLGIEFEQGKVKADVLCAGDVCIDASQLQQLLDAVSTPAPSDEPTPGMTPESTPEITPESTPEITPEATPEETPESTPEEPAETPVPEPENTP